MSFFTNTEELAEDSLFALKRQIEEARAKGKDVLNLAVGEYLEGNAYPKIFSVVKEAESELFRQETTKGYGPILGKQNFLDQVAAHIYSDEPKDLIKAQTLGGSGALYIAGRMLFRVLGIKKILVSTPTWGNHKTIFSEADLDVEEYTYYDRKKGIVKFDAMMDEIREEIEPCALLLHACCHNPTGADLTPSQWDEVCKLLKEKDNIFPVIDMAYHGFAKGFKEDAYCVNKLYKEGIEHFLCYSFSKNLGLYGERLGAFVCYAESNIKAIKSQIARIQRASVSNPPIHPMAIALKVLKEKKQAWDKELSEKREILDQIRSKFSEKMKKPSYKKGHGMFCLAGESRAIEKSQYQTLQENGIFMPRSSRINLTNLDENNMERFIAVWQELK